MELVTKNIAHYNAVIHAWRVARWANHAWGNLPDGSLAEVWKVSPSLAGFAEILPGYAVAKGWVVEGPVGFGILGPELVADNWQDQRLRVWVGSHSQLSVECHPDWTRVKYTHGDRWAEAEAEYAGGLVMVVGCGGYEARPRDWARLARALCVAYDLRDNRAEAVAESLRNMVPTEWWAEFDTYFAIRGPEILVGPEGILAAI